MQADMAARRFQCLIENALDIITILDAAGIIRYQSPAIEPTLGYGREEMNGKWCFDYVHPDDLPHVRHLYDELLLCPGATLSVEYRFRHADGSWRLLESRGRNLLMQPGVEAIVINSRDISANKQAEEALRASEQQYRYLAESIPQIVWTAAPDGSRDYYNQRWMEYTGLTLEQTLAGGAREALHPEDLPLTRHAWAQARQTGGDYQREHRIRGGDGVYRWFLTRAAPMRDPQGNILKWFGTATDIDAQKSAQARERLLSELGEQMRATPDPQDVMWAVVRMVGEHLQVSRCYYTDTDVDADKVIIHRDYCRGVASWAGTYRLSSFGAGVQAELNVGKTVTIADTAADSRTASQYEDTYAPTDIRAYVAVPLMEGGKRVASFVVSVAGNPRAWTPEEVALLETVAARTRLAVENSRLWQAERERSAQLARAIQEVHHRVKNSLQGVSALLEMQLPFDSDVMPVETMRQGLNQIRVIALVHDLLARDQPIGKVNAGVVLTKLAQLMSAGLATAERPAPVQARTDEAWIPTKAATALALTVQELITNADKHSRNYKGTDGLNTQPIEVRLTKQGEKIVVVVQDCGPGFPSNFNPLKSANIGLELVLTLVRHDLGGSVTFTNRADHNANIRGGQVEILFSEGGLAE